MGVGPSTRRSAGLRASPWPSAPSSPRASPSAPEATVSLSVFAAAREAPAREAVITDRETLTWAELADRVRAAVAALRARGLDGPDPVGLVAANDLPTFETVHALVALGVPALLLHPRLTAA
ncbi:MAG: AMP-binding protein, partial [Gemmatimonadetes bacterium]|nr:AMP-binding protein [Gemmatimonadota bacterium]NIQ52564.1 AMP-binding protein [Gemmatimonadota bacterium]NIU72702.1 AMP-binding protein [Gammaproteobacteria bacterium]NIX43108.1 AMP-binding protein [Gemmatimonadota bacterium]NIY07270.1 AMP-binding protein [Gemmatimonadota bacterium]